MLGTSCDLKWREAGEKERLWVVEPGHPIPTAQFAAVAEVLRYVYQLQGKTIPGADRAA